MKAFCIVHPDPDLVNVAEQVGYWIRFVWNERLYYRTFQGDIYASAGTIVYETDQTAHASADD